MSSQVERELFSSYELGPVVSRLNRDERRVPLQPRRTTAAIQPPLFSHQLHPNKEKHHVKET
ncbi:hypothetical protein [Tunturiibacter lichenicola]|uniref:hypothetical protein n=1 Tax=Tunturiibacter lichenicola TaxID=2051959 RepID=UPI0021B33ADA|nr:hypothetical protein [Edaphobacter lichenicola]